MPAVAALSGAAGVLVMKVRGCRSALARGANERFHVVEIAFEGATTVWCDRVLRLRHASLEGLRARDVLRLLQLARMDAEIAVRGVEQLLEIVEAERVGRGQRAENAESHAFVNQAVERERPFTLVLSANATKRRAG